MSNHTILVKGATVHDGLGSVLNDCDVRIADGQFCELGADLSCSGSQVLNAEGLEMFPGFVVPLSPWGGAGPVLGAGNLSENSSLVTPELDVRYAFQPDSIAYQQLYRWGITSSCLTPDFTNLFSGQSAVYKTYADCFTGYLLKEKAFAAASLSGIIKDIHAGKRYAETDMGLIHLFSEALSGALAAGNTTGSQVLADIISGRLPLAICCDSRDMWDRIAGILECYPDIQITLCGTYGVKRDDLERFGRRISFIHFSMADADWNIVSRIDFNEIEAMLEEGYLFAPSPYLSEAEMTHAEAVLWNAAVMYKNGVKAEHVVKSLCSIPARILGAEERIGSIAPGRDADFSLWTGNPVTSFEARMKHVFINGAEIADREVGQTCW